MALLALPTVALGAVSTSIAWSPSADSRVTGYNIYYGTNSHDYTSMISVGNVASAVIANLAENTTYYFAAKAHDAAGVESDFSNEASFSSYSVSAGGILNLKTVPDSLANDQLTFSLGPNTPSDMSISTNGVLSWNSSRSDANTTKTVTVSIADLSNPQASLQMTIVIGVSDFCDLTLPSVPVQAGQSGSLPLTLVTSDGATNVSFTLNWPGNRLRNPVLYYNAPVSGGTFQYLGTNLIVKLWTANGDVLTGTNQIAQLVFKPAPGQPSAFVPITVSNISGYKANGQSFQNLTAETGEVVVIGTNPLLRPQLDAGQKRALTLYANPGNYQLQTSADLSSRANWQPLLNYTQTNLSQTVSLDSTHPVAFYRLMQE